ncbi:hypothetical protein [Cohnella sp. GbtcB17]|uniref:hypothetical protein n=1 Tax=Cohnella sp. GbtcB17 TaxID=2824762 RepID=UPI001C30D8E2|nr:hypothetical protein [Cohnella sp. GbtcB17]
MNGRTKDADRRRTRMFVLGAAVLALFAAGIWGGIRLNGGTRHAAEHATLDGVKMSGKVGDEYLQVYRNGTWIDLPVKGVNMGIAKPGHFPGEAAITKEEYARWFRQIGEMHANVLRVYTIHPPAFYEAFLDYNRKAKEPLYLMHGVWANEENLASTQDAYASVNTDDFVQEIRRTVDIIHGNANVPAKPGHASGRYKADISEYVIGWLLGIEWDPSMVDATDKKHAGMQPFQGAYFKTDGASPFESWLARMMDETASYETEKYGWQRPMSFTNWVTTDPLSHPAEPSATEDMVSVDPNHIVPAASMKAGYFASYHIYPYYPEFLNYEQKYTSYVDQRGKPNNYAGYLHDLKAAHRMPLVVAEFGVPSSRGLTHRSVGGRNQGFHTEKEQGDIDAGMYEDIRAEGLAGGIVFTWQDEWFKRTWNTMDYDNPDRRPFWSNAQTGEQQFGILAFDPGAKRTAVYPDGDGGDWDKLGVKPVKASQAAKPESSAASEEAGAAQLQSYRVASDERYVYIRIDTADAAGKSVPIDWSRTGFLLLVDSAAGQGQHTVPGGSGLRSEAGFDFAVDLRGPDQSRIWVDSYYDLFHYQYGRQLQMIPDQPYASRPDNGVWHPIRLALNKGMVIPDRPEGEGHIPFDSYETGMLRFGNANPDSPSYDSLADVCASDKDGMVELRIPWQLLGVRDPSTHEINGDVWKNGLAAAAKTDGLRMAAVAYDAGSANKDQPGGRTVTGSIPAAAGGTLRAADMNVYSWSGWELPTYHERLKASYYVLQNLFKSNVKE